MRARMQADDLIDRRDLDDLRRLHGRHHQTLSLTRGDLAVLGAALLLLLGLMPLSAGPSAVVKGSDVYLFLIGMMLLSETARDKGLSDWVAATAAINARGSAARMFLLVYVTGTMTTTFLSNDATAVVLTPAVYAAANKGKAEPLSLLFACALIATAASFVLPISNPANLVLYGGKMPPLGQWFGSFALPLLVAIVVTYGGVTLGRTQATVGRV
jgi:arsenical pump membrane protein